MKKEKYWIWYWGSDQEQLYLVHGHIEFDDFEEMKEYSAAHSSANKSNCKSYWSNYIKVTPTA